MDADFGKANAAMAGALMPRDVLSCAATTANKGLLPLFSRAALIEFNLAEIWPAGTPCGVSRKQGGLARESRAQQFEI